jgi:hypothetical protein
MRIENQPSVARTTAARPSGVRRSGAFAALVGGSSAGPAQTSAPVGLIGGVIALDPDTDAAGRRSRGLAAGHDLLDEMEGLRRELLAGAVSAARMGAIAAKLDAMAPDADPALAAIIDEIRLRVAVEIAKLSPAHIAACRSLACPV